MGQERGGVFNGLLARIDIGCRGITSGNGLNVLSGSSTLTVHNTIDVTGVELLNIDYVDAGKGNDTIYGSAGADVILGGAGNDHLYGAEGDDLYRFEAGHGQDQVQDQGTGDSDMIRFTASADPAAFWLSRSGADLVIERVGAGEQVTLVGWWAATPDGVAQIELEGGPTLLEADVQALVDALAPFEPGEVLSPEDQASVDAAIAAAWN